MDTSGTLRISAVLFVVATSLATMVSGQRRPLDDIPSTIREAILTERLTVSSELASIRTNIALVQQTADASRNEIAEVRRALYGVVGTLLGSILMQFFQFKKTRP